MNYDEREAVKEKLLKKFDGSKDNVIRWLLIHIDTLDFEIDVKNDHYSKMQGIKIERVTPTLKDVLDEL